MYTYIYIYGCVYVINIILETYLKLSFTRRYRNKRDAALHTASRSVELYDNPQGFTNHIPKIYMGTGDILYFWLIPVFDFGL